MQINQERVNNIAKKLKWVLPLFVKSIEIKGENNLDRLIDKPTIFLPNHLSNLDDIIIPKIIHSHGLKHPAIIAANHLSKWPTGRWFNEETGAIFINRNLIEKGTKEEKAKELLKKRKSIEEVVDKNYNFMVFVEGGFRHFDGKVMEDISISYPRDYILEIKRKNKNLEEYFGCNVAIKYLPYPIEFPFIEKSRKFKEKIKNAESPKEESKYIRKYYLTDIKGYIRQIMKLRKPIVKVNIGEPYSLKSFSNNGQHFELEKFVKEDVRRLYNEL